MVCLCNYAYIGCYIYRWCFTREISIDKGGVLASQANPATSWRWSRSTYVSLTAPTGTTIFKIGGSTLHSALHLPMGRRYYSMQHKDSAYGTFKTSFANLNNIILIIGEISMVGRRMFAYIHNWLQEAKGVEGINKLFGGVSVLCVRDFYQLPPVMQRSVFDSETTPKKMLTKLSW